MQDILSSVILNSYSNAKEIVSVQSYRPSYLQYPARITIQTIDGNLVTCSLKVSEDVNRLSFEAKVLEALTELGLSVPKVFAGPVTIQCESGSLTFLLISELSGQPLPWIKLSDLNAAHHTCQLVHEAVDTLHSLIPELKSHSVATLLPSVTLESELQKLLSTGGKWPENPIFAEALALLRVTIPQFSYPLVFSNGDYNPLNFLAAENRITGWIDFEYACFEDPYIGFAKFLLWADDDYGWGTGVKTGLVERYLYKHNVAPQAFFVRLVLRGVSYLQQANPTDVSKHMLNVITESVYKLRASV